MIKFLNRWIFINYCGQKIGQFEHSNMKGYMLNIFNAQIGHILNIFVLNIYFILGFRSVFGFIFLLIVDNIIIRFFIRKFLMPLISLNQLEQQYIKTSRNKKLINFSISLVVVIASFLLFVFSFLVQSIFK